MRRTIRATAALVLVVPFLSSAQVCADINACTVLSYGSKGQAVVELQTNLTALGYLEADSATGNFGPLTRNAVRAFQVAQNIVSSGDENTTGFGVAGPRTRGALTMALATSKSTYRASSDSTSALIEALLAQLAVLQKQLAILLSTRTPGADTPTSIPVPTPVPTPSPTPTAALSPTPLTPTPAPITPPTPTAATPSLVTPPTLPSTSGSDTTPPAIAIVLPDGSSISGPWADIRATSTDASGVVQVEFKYKKVGSDTYVTLGKDTTASGIAYEHNNWDTTVFTGGDRYDLFAVAIDTAGNRATSSKRVYINGSMESAGDQPAGYRPGAYGDTPILRNTSFVRPQGGVQIMLWAYTPFESPIVNFFPYIKREVDYIFFAQPMLGEREELDPYGRSEFFRMLRELKTKAPGLKVGIKGGHGSYLAPWDIPYASMADSDWLHDALIGGYVINGKENKLHKQERFLNLPSVTTRNKVVDIWRSVFAANPLLDSVFLDGHRNHFSNIGLTNGCTEGPCNTPGFWDLPIQQYDAALQAVVPGDLVYNGINALENAQGTLSRKGELNEGWLANTDGALLEWAHEIYLSPDNFDKYVRILPIEAAKGKKIFYYVQTQHLYPRFSLAERPNNLSLEQFYLASYLLIQTNPYTYFAYNPGAQYRINHGMYFYENWNYDYGAPNREAQKLSSGLYERRYSKGIAVVNPTSSQLSYTFPGGAQYRVWHPTSGGLVSGTVSVPAKTGVFYFRQQ